MSSTKKKYDFKGKLKRKYIKKLRELQDEVDSVIFEESKDEEICPWYDINVCIPYFEVFIDWYKERYNSYINDLNEYEKSEDGYGPDVVEFIRSRLQDKDGNFDKHADGDDNYLSIKGEELYYKIFKSVFDYGEFTYCFE